MRSQHFDLPKILTGSAAMILVGAALLISALTVIRDITGYFVP